MEIFILRPWAFIFLVPAVFFCFFRLRAVKTWLGIVDSHLLKPLLVRVRFHLKESMKIILMILSCLSFLCALAGIGFKGKQKNLYYPKSPAVIVLDMSSSMKVRDISPNRFSRAVFKTYDLLDELTGIPTALIIFSDEPYQLVPTTTEKDAIKALLPLLNFNLLPSAGSRVDRALQEALRTIKESGAEFGDIFLITDGTDEVFEIQDKASTLIRSAAKDGNRLFILGVGTTKGGGLFEKENTPVLDALGNPVIHRLKEAWLRRLAVEGNGEYRRIDTDRSDVTALIKAYGKQLEAGEKSSLTDNQSVSDEGYWFLLLPLFAFPFLFRQGRFLVYFFVFSLPFQAQAADMAELFLSPSGAAMHFLNKGHQAKAIKIAEESQDFTALYNVGTRLIYLYNYPKAQELLEKAVAQRPDDENAQINLEIAKRLNQKPPADGSSDDSQKETPESDNPSGTKGTSKGENDLNQDNKNAPQQHDNNEKKQNSDGQNSSGQENNNTGDNPSDPGDNKKESGGDPEKQNSSSDSNNGQNTPPSEEKGGISQGSGDSGNAGGSEKNDETPSDDQNDMIPVHEDPLTLLRHKILFLYQENRYAGEKRIGTQW